MIYVYMYMYIHIYVLYICTHMCEYIYIYIYKRGMRPQSGHRAQHAYYVMRKQRHGVDLAIYGPKVWHRGARGAASGGPRCGIGGFWGSKSASLGVEKGVSGSRKVRLRGSKSAPSVPTSLTCVKTKKVAPLQERGGRRQAARAGGKP